MPLSYLIDVPRRVIFIRGWGVFSDGELRQAARALLSDPRFDSDHARLMDFRSVTQFGIGADSIRQAGLQLSRDSSARRALVVTGELAYGLARMSQLGADSPADVSLVCHDLESALAWLNLPPTLAWPSDPPDRVVDESG